MSPSNNDELVLVINNKKSYKIAIEQIDFLLEKDSLTSRESEELEHLQKIILEYEKEKNFAPEESDPINCIKKVLETRDYSQSDLVKYMGSPSVVSEILNGKRELTLDMIRNLNQYLDIPARVLIKKSEMYFPKTLNELDYSKFPESDIKSKFKWKPKNFVNELKEKIQNIGGSEVLELVFFRKSDKMQKNSNNDFYALLAWSIEALNDAQGITTVNKFKKGTVNLNFLKEIIKLSADENGPLKAKEYLENKGIKLITLHHLRRTYLDGAVFMDKDNNPVIALTLRYDRLDNFWFVLLHELAHIGLHLDNEDADSNFFIDDLSSIGNDEKEIEADNWVNESTIPKKIWDEWIEDKKEYCSKEYIHEFASELGLHPAIVAGRYRHETKNFRIFSRMIGQGEVRKLFWK